MPKETFFNLPEEKRNRIAELAIDEFADNPYTSASISRIVQKAGIAKGSFYQYFDNKLDLYRWLLFSVLAMRKLEFLKGDPPAADLDFFAQLEHLMMTGLRFGLENPRLTRVAWWLRPPLGDPELKPLYYESLKASRLTMRGAIEQARVNGFVRPGIDVDLAAEFCLSVLQQGLDMALERKLGTSLLELCSRPDLAAQFGVDDQRALISSVVDLLRWGMGAPQPGGTPDGKSMLDLDWNAIMPADVRTS